jgi:D-alanine-D-alanine ligase
MPTPPPCDVTVVLGDPRLADAAKVRGLFGAEDHDAFARMKAALGRLAEARGYRFRFLDDHGRLLSVLAASPPAFVLNFCDTGFRNRAALEPHVPALLELLDVPYSGAGPGCLALCYDKAAVRAIAAELGVPVPEERFLRPDEPIEAGVPARFPALIKPNRGDGSVGITQKAVVQSEPEALDYLAGLRRDDPGREVLVQEYLEGTEYGIGLVGNPRRADAAGGFTALPPMEVDFGDLPEGLPPILCYESKADPDSPYYTRIGYRRARLPADELARMVGWSELLFARLGCRDWARFDFRAGADGGVRLLEVNPNPAWCWDGKMAFMVGFDGGDYDDLLRLVLEAAQERVAASQGAR